MMIAEFFKVYYIEQQYGVSWILNDVLVVLCAVLLFNRIEFRSGRYWLKTAAAAALSWVFVILAESLVYFIFGDPFTKQLVFPVYIALYAAIMSRYSWLVRIIYCVVFYSVLLNLIIISVVLGVILTQNMLLAELLLMALSVLCVIFLQYFYIEQYEKPSFYFVILMIISALAILLSFVSEFIFIRESASRIYGLVVNASMILFELGTYYIFYHFVKAYNKSQYLLARTIKQSTYDQMREINETNYIELRKMRHELKNQYAYIKELLRNKDYAGVERYFSGLNSEFEEVISVIDSGNKVLDNILNLAAAKAKSAGVTLETQIMCPPELPYGESDLTGLLLNLLDNAFEACGRIGGGSPKTVCVSVRSQHKYLLVRVSNPLVTGVDARDYLSLKTSKADAENHGFGIKIIRGIAEKYRGQVNFRIENGLFIADVMLESPAEE